MLGIAIKDVIGLLGIVFFLMSLFLLFMPVQVRQFNDFSKKWISVRRVLRCMEITKNVDDKFFSKIKLIGSVSLVLTVVYLCWYLIY
ncbi:unnamed protein product [marine sediment metagenome]|uniref:Uncharacterized protein n=1 Tax=marine sediment metagenome TaxID=412755 RepID=X0UAI8_9ZZZZ